MKRESVVFLLCGTFFGLVVGWLIGSQQGTPPATVQTAAAAPAAASEAPSAPALDVQRATQLEQTAKAEPSNVAARAELGNLYFNAERYDLAIPWYEQAQKLEPKDVNVSTDLGVCYYYTNQADRALQQFDHSLSLDPKHVKTLFNQGIVRAFGKQDLAGAEQAWQRVVELAPDSEEGKRAKQGLEGLKAGHSSTAPASAPEGRGRTGGG
jgi:cytochrome c-type biogenesis protein CcmH/NrfG